MKLLWGGDGQADMIKDAGGIKFSSVSEGTYLPTILTIYRYLLGHSSLRAFMRLTFFFLFFFFRTVFLGLVKVFKLLAFLG